MKKRLLFVALASANILLMSKKVTGMESMDIDTVEDPDVTHLTEKMGQMVLDSVIIGARIVERNVGWYTVRLGNTNKLFNVTPKEIGEYRVPGEIVTVQAKVLREPEKGQYLIQMIGGRENVDTYHYLSKDQISGYPHPLTEEEFRRAEESEATFSGYSFVVH